MANENRTYRLQGANVEKIIDSLKAYLTVNKSMEVQSAPTTDGYVLQASQPKDAWKTISGMRLAITVHMTVIGDVLNVTVGEGQWADKIGAGAIGWFIAGPLAVTAIVGSVRLKKLPEEIFGVIERSIYTGGTSVVINGSGAVVEAIAEAKTPALEAGNVPCPECGANNPAGSKFCNNCGSKMFTVCPECGEKVTGVAKFCNNCGAKLK